MIIKLRAHESTFASLPSSCPARPIATTTLQVTPKRFSPFHPAPSWTRCRPRACHNRGMHNAILSLYHREIRLSPLKPLPSTLPRSPFPPFLWMMLGASGALSPGSCFIDGVGVTHGFTSVFCFRVEQLLGFIPSSLPVSALLS